MNVVDPIDACNVGPLFILSHHLHDHAFQVIAKETLDVVWRLAGSNQIFAPLAKPVFLGHAKLCQLSLIALHMRGHVAKITEHYFIFVIGLFVETYVALHEQLAHVLLHTVQFHFLFQLLDLDVGRSCYL